MPVEPGETRKQRKVKVRKYQRAGRRQAIQLAQAADEGYVTCAGCHDPVPIRNAQCAHIVPRSLCIEVRNGVEGHFRSEIVVNLLMMCASCHKDTEGYNKTAYVTWDRDGSVLVDSLRLQLGPRNAMLRSGWGARRVGVSLHE